MDKVNGRDFKEGRDQLRKGQGASEELALFGV